MTEPREHPPAPTETPPEGPGPASHRHRARRWLWTALVLLVGVPMLLLVATVGVIRTSDGTAWLLSQVPGLTVDRSGGTLLGDWRADRLRWQGFGVRLDIQAPHLDWSPRCLLAKTLCVDALTADQVDVVTVPGEDATASAGPIDLPTLDLPVSLDVSGVAVGALTVNGANVWDTFSARLEGSGADWQVRALSYRRGDLSLSLNGKLETRGDWPLDLALEVGLPSPDDGPWTLSTRLQGSAHDLRLSGSSAGYLEATFNGGVAPLDPDLPAQLTVRSPRFAATGDLPKTLTFNDIDLTAAGSLADGFQTRGSASLPGTQGPVSVNLQGLVSAGAAREIQLTLSAAPAGDVEAGKGKGTVTVNGEVNWSDGLDAQADLSLDRFPWFTLIPGMAPPPVTVSSLNGKASYRGGRYQADLQANTQGPLGRARVTASLEGDGQGLKVPRLRLASPAGSLDGQAQLGFQGRLSWQAQLDLDGFNPGYWLPALTASLDGQVQSEGHLTDGPVPSLTASWDLKGRWQKQPTRASGALDTRSGAWQLSDLAVDVGDNRIRGKGTWGERLDGRLSLALPTPEQILPGLKGRIEGQATVSGTAAAPTGKLSLTADGVAWQDQVSAETVRLNATLSADRSLSSSLAVTGLEAAGQRADSIDAGLDGTLGKHRLTLDIQQPEDRIRLAFAGGFVNDGKGWQGALENGRIDVPEQDQRWQLEAPAALSWRADKGVTFGQHCWRWQQSTVCADDQQLWPNPDIAYRITGFPTQALAPLLPDTLRWQATLNGQIGFTLTDQGPTGTVDLDAGQGRFEVLVDGDWKPLDYQTLTTHLNLDPDRARVKVNVAGKGVGDLSLAMTIDPSRPSYPVDGEFDLKHLDLALAGVFTGLQEVGGDINGHGTLSGPLLKPAVTGQLVLSDGRLMDPTLPVPMEQIDLEVALEGQSATLDGRIRSNARSDTSVNGTVGWGGSGGPSADIAIKGRRIPVTVEPYARVEVASDLTIRFEQGELSVIGQVNVPRGEVEIQSLPEQAVQVSDDEVVVGADKPEPAIRALNMDVTVRVGDDEVTFSAFGLTGNLEGNLRIGNDLDTRGTLQLVDGRYEAYGQELELRKARLLFVGNLTQPYLDVVAIRQVDSVTAGLRLSGPVQSPQTEVFSNPDMPQSDALSYLILGRPPQSQGDRGAMDRAALSLGLTQASKLTGKVGNELGIRNLALETEGSGDATSVVASGYLTQDLSVRYGVGIFEPITTVALRYDLGKYFYLEAASGLAASLDIFYTRDF